MNKWCLTFSQSCSSFRVKCSCHHDESLQHFHWIANVILSHRTVIKSCCTVCSLNNFRHYHKAAENDCLHRFHRLTVMPYSRRGYWRVSTLLLSWRRLISLYSHFNNFKHCHKAAKSSKYFTPATTTVGCLVLFTEPLQRVHMVADSLRFFVSFHHNDWLHILQSCQAFCLKKVWGTLYLIPDITTINALFCLTECHTFQRATGGLR